MKVSDVMTRAVDFVDPSASVQAAATLMAELDVGAVIIGTADRIDGILTDRDIIVRLVVEGLHPARIGVREIMTPDVITCLADDDIEQAFAAMREGQFRRMPVLEGDGKPVGVVTMSDLAKHVESPEKVAEKLREISEPHRSREAPEEIPSGGEAVSDSPETEGKRKASAA
jgi:CBS domain-containing protein